MRLTIKPWSSWVSYNIERSDVVERLLPPSLRLARTPLFDDEWSERPQLMFNTFEVIGPWMRGIRTEVVVYTKCRRTGRPSFVILDCVSNTMRWDPCNGVRLPNAFSSLSPFHVQVRSDIGRLSYRIDTASSRSRRLSRRFAVEANRVFYFFSHPTGYGLTFNESEVSQPVQSLNPLYVRNDMWQSVRSAVPSHCFVHPHGMSFDIDEPITFSLGGI